MNSMMNISYKNEARNSNVIFFNMHNFQNTNLKYVKNLKEIRKK